MKLRNKLILSCAALAAVATTAVSTTFAWYTANDTVKANGITGKTSTQDATLLLISKTGKQGNWGASVDINTSDVTLDPVTYMKADKYLEVKNVVAGETVVTGYYTKEGNNYTEVTGKDTKAVADTTYYAKKEAGKYYQWDSAANQEGALATANGQYISFYLYFKSGSSQSLDVTIDKFNLRNTTPALPTNTVLAAGTGSTETSYTIDMLRATNIVVTTYQGKEVEATADANPVIPANATSEQAVRTAYACDSQVKKVTKNEQQVDWDSYVAEQNTGTAQAPVYTGSNAHRYYNNVKTLTGNDAIDTSILTSEAELGDVSTLVGADNKYKFTVQTGAGAAANGGLDNILMVKFDIYLDGWDVACFDACRKQTIALDMEFTGSPHKEQQSGGN